MTQTLGDNISPRPGSGSLADLVSVSEPPQAVRGLPVEAYVKIALLGALFVIVNYWQWPILVPKWLKEDDWQHGLAIPLFGLYLLYCRRHELLSAPRKGCWWGLVIMIGAALMEVIGFYPLCVAYIFHVGMVFLLFGLVLFMAGPKVMKVVWLPILFWILAMPLPPLLYNNIAFHLQNLAAKWSAVIMLIFGVHVDVSGSFLTFASIAGKECNLEVAGACSGIHSLMAYLSLGVAMAYLQDRPVWQRIVLLLSIIPVAIFTNVLRVAITIEMYYLDHPELGDKFMHELTGLFMLVPTFLLLWLISWVLKRIFVEVEDKPSAAAGGAKTA
jgi:exosortase